MFSGLHLLQQTSLSQLQLVQDGAVRFLLLELILAPSYCTDMLKTRAGLQSWVLRWDLPEEKQLLHHVTSFKIYENLAVI